MRKFDGRDNKINDIKRKFHNVFNKTEDTKNRSILVNYFFDKNISINIIND